MEKFNAEEYLNELKSQLTDAAGDYAFESVAAANNNIYESEDTYTYITKGRKEGVRDLEGYVADELYNDAFWVRNQIGDRIFSHAQDIDRRDARNVTIKMAEEMLKLVSTKEALHDALLDIANKKKLKVPKYYRLPSVTKFIKDSNKHEKLKSLPPPPMNVASEINKSSKIAKNAKILAANDGKQYAQISGKWYQLSEKAENIMNKFDQVAKQFINEDKGKSKVTIVLDYAFKDSSQIQSTWMDWAENQNILTIEAISVIDDFEMIIGGSWTKAKSAIEILAYGNTTTSKLSTVVNEFTTLVDFSSKNIIAVIFE